MNKGFTLLEMLIVVLIIGILTAIALPQYKRAVNKAKVAQVLPSMRRWKDALMEYKLQNNSYCKKGTEEDCVQLPDASDIEAKWPSDWSNGNCGNSHFCSNDFWDCSIDSFGAVYCDHIVAAKRHYAIVMYQPDDPYQELFRNKIICSGFGNEMRDFCRGIGGKPIEEGSDIFVIH